MTPVDVTLLSTKFHAPRPRGALVARESLLRRLDHIPAHRLILVSAPAGFGKSTLLGAWIERSSMPTAWLSLEARDDSFVRFLTYMVSSVSTILPQFGADILDALSATPNPQVEPLMSAFVNAISTVERDFLLALDDFHLIGCEEVVAAIRFLLDHASDTLHLALLTRSDPPFPLSRLRVSGRLLELRAEDLRCTNDEATDLMESLGLSVEESAIEALQQKTEGWIAGLKMAALSLQGRDDPKEFVEAFTGADKFVLEYLLEEVVGRQPESIQRAITALSVLDEFNGSLAEATAGMANGQEFLERLDKSNLFLVPLDNRREWYRYHHLFADLLLHRLQRLFPDDIPHLHRKAAAWYDERGIVREAVVHAHGANDPDMLISLLEKYWLRIFRDFSLDDLSALCNLPDHVLMSHPRLAFLRSYGLYERRDHDEMQRLFPLIEHAAASDPEQDALRGSLALLRAIVARDRGQYTEALEQGELALALLPDKSVDDPDYQWNLSRGMILSFLAQGNSAIGNRDEALRRIHLAWIYAQTRGDFRTLIYALINLAYDAWAIGDIDETLRYCDRMLAEDERMALIAPHQRLLPRQIKASAMLYRNELNDALKWALEAEEHTPQAGSQVYVAETYRILILIYEAMGDTPGVDRSLAALEGVRIAIPRHQWIIPMIKARSDLMRGQTLSAIIWVATYMHGERYELQSPNANERAIAHLFRARLLIAQKKFDDAIAALELALTETRGVDRFKQELERVLLMAIALESLGRTAEATALVREAMVRAAPQRIVRPFVTEGHRMASIVERVVQEEATVVTLSSAYLRALMAALGKSAPATRQEIAVIPSEWALTEREIEILKLIAQGYSNQKIADRLYLSINTVKTHTANLYDKLGVRSRTEAIARATQAGALL